jgi:3-deoxy-manno-octulosonate cytidylyltransferase (CMP-KDO synthetase)
MPHNNERPQLRVVIPARYASSRLPGKPLIDLVGLPMVVRVYKRAAQALQGTDIVVATDDERIARVLQQHAVPFVMTAVEHESGSERAAEVARLLDWPASDIIVNLQGDEPLLPVDLLQAFADFCLARADLEMASITAPLSVREQIQDPNIVKVVLDQQDRAILFSRAMTPFCRDLPIDQWPLSAFWRHIGIYAYRNATLQRLMGTPVCSLEALEKLEQLRAIWLGIPIAMMKWHAPLHHGVDTPQDIDRVTNTLLEEGL